MVGVEKFESESPLLSSKNEAGGGVCKNVEEFCVFRCNGGQTGVEIGLWGNDVLCQVGVTSSWRGVTFCEMTHEERGEIKVRREAKCWSGETKNSFEFANASSCSDEILAISDVRRLVLGTVEAGFCSEVRYF